MFKVKIGDNPIRWYRGNEVGYVIFDEFLKLHRFDLATIQKDIKRRNFEVYEAMGWKYRVENDFEEVPDGDFYEKTFGNGAVKLTRRRVLKNRRRRGNRPYTLERWELTMYSVLHTDEHPFYIIVKGKNLQDTIYRARDLINTFVYQMNEALFGRFGEYEVIRLKGKLIHKNRR